MVLEAAGADEEVEGRPVVGKAGQYLFQQLARAGVEREMFRIHNVLSCRPPGNKLAGMPWEKAAIAHCAPNLDATISETRDRAKRNGKTFVILTLGKTAFKRIMGLHEHAPMMKKDYRNYPHWHEDHQAWVIAADHPSYLMRGNNHLTPVLQFAAQRALEIARDGIKLDQPTFLEDPPAPTFSQWVNDYLEAEKRAPAETYLSYDIETPFKVGKDEDEVSREDDDDYTILRCSFAYREGEAVSVPWTAPYMPDLARLFAHSGIKLGHNLNYDAPRVSRQLPINGKSVDNMLAWHVLNTSLPKGLGFITPFYNPTAPMWKHMTEERPAFYNAADAYYTWKDFLGIKRDLERNGLWNVFERHIVMLNEALAYMTGKGVLLDQPGREAAELRLADQLDLVAEKMDQAVPRAVHELKIYKKTPKDVAGLEIVPGTRTAKVCNLCGRVDALAPHFKSVGKKRLKAGEPENTCFGGTASKIDVPADLFAERLPFSLSNQSLQRYQKVMGHKAILSREERKVTFDVNALKLLRKQYQDDPLYKVIDEFRKVQKLLTTYVGVTEDKRLLVPHNYELKDGEAWTEVPKKRKPKNLTPEQEAEWERGEKAAKRAIFRTVIRGGMPTDNLGLVHTTFTHNPSTLRLASQNPNLQNLPRPNPKDPNAIQNIPRNLIIPEPGHVFLARDFSGIEAVLVGYEARSRDYIRLAKRDVHSFYTAYAIAELEPGRLSKNDLPLLSWDDEKLFARLAEIKKEFGADRNSLYKHLVHACNFGQGAKGAQEKIFKETDRLFDIRVISRVMDLYRELFGVIPKWQREVQLQADRDGYLRNAFGYIHRFNRVFSWKQEFGKWVKIPGDDAEAVLAMRPQSNAAAIIKEAILRLYFQRFEEAGRFLRLQVHDEIFTQVPVALVEQVDAVLQEEMERPIEEMPLPPEWDMGPFMTVLTEAKVGAPWGGMK